MLILACLLTTASASGQNVVSGTVDTPAADPTSLNENDLQRVLDLVPARPPVAGAEKPTRLHRKLADHVAQLLEHFPYQAFQHTLGISNYEVYFNHPDELFYALSIALPYLPQPLAEKTKRLLQRELEPHAPYLIEGYVNAVGSNRTSYIIPDDVRINGRSAAKDVFGVYALWAYCHYVDDLQAAQRHWPKVKARVESLVNQPYDFDIRRTDYTNDEAEHLNADLAGLIGYLRLARVVGDTTAAEQARPRCLDLLQRRINLERVNPAFVNATHSTTSHLHVFKLARYVDLMPSVGRSLHEHAPVAVDRLREFRAERETWFMAYGDRLIGGENYTNPPHFSRSLFSSAALIEQLDAEQLTSFVDVPWCAGDLYFIEKVAVALWAASGRDWETLP